jgi:hypothetical protein
MLSRRSWLAGAAAVLATGAGGAALADGVVDLLARITRARAQVRTIVGPFTQTRTIGLLATDVRSTGTLTLVVPDRLRWELGPPDDVTFWVGPEGFAYRSAHGQGRIPATTARLAGALRDLHVLLAGDLAQLKERWNLRVLRDDATGAEIEASSTSAAAVRSMRITLAQDLVRPIRALLVEGERDRTSIEFGDLKVNVPVAEAAMHPPA